MNVQISRELFVALCRYHLLGDDSAAEKISQGLETKLDALARREQYTTYKTADTPDERERARQAYLESKGIPEDFRW